MSVEQNRAYVLPVDGRPDEETWDDPVRGRISFTPLFSGDTTPTSELTTGIAVVPPGGWLGLHRHAVTETYLMLEGVGVVTIDGVDSTVQPGDTVFLPADAEHGFRNTGPATVRLYYAYATDSMNDITYRFSGE